ncbi:DinB family protein [Intrasporangium sp.]|uniref:DinB family protein n=1 Tax=Intrasporangium sp. TaxID=1925024 RepID=UPI00293957B0|nr:DinB family protein [Intrasporangium sp.]MDV3223403.1 DinB family protein [Intrasporangium sp.]
MSTKPSEPTTQPTDTDWTAHLVEQIDWHWTNQLRPRLEGLTDEEYFWRPTPGAWSVHPRGEGTAAIEAGSGDYTIDWAFPEPVPAPLTTISWRLGHIIVGVLGARLHGHFGGPQADYTTWDYSSTAAGALAQLDEAYAAWLAGIRTWTGSALLEPCGPAEGPWAQAPRVTLVLHINRELIHHGAEIALLRDLWAHRND